MNRAALEWRLFLVAVQFLTRVPVPTMTRFDPDWLNQSARYFPLVGTCVGAAIAAMWWLASFVWPPAVAAVLAIGGGLVLTGGFHEDGLADTFDALGGHVPRDRALEIMKDSRIGTYGALALLVVLGLKTAVLAAMPLALAIPALLLAHTVSRAAAVVFIRLLPYAGDIDHAKSKPLARQVSGAGTSIAIAWAALLAAVLLVLAPSQAPLVIAGMASALVGAVLMWRWLRSRLGGYTGDGLGATQQITESLCMLGWLAAARWAA